MELRDALTQIAEIRAQMARTEVFRGFRSTAVAFSGVLASAGGFAQASWVPDPLANLYGYVALWIVVAALSVLAVASEFLLRAQLSRSPLTRQLFALVVEQFLPCILAGALLTFVVLWRTPEIGWALPGLWAILFSLGVFACHRLLPHPIYFGGAYYLIAGLVALAFGARFALSPWLMPALFTPGQLLTAGILYTQLERRRHVEGS